MNQENNLELGGTFYFKHIRNGKVIAEEFFDNIFTNEGLAYALNCAFGVPVGGAPAAKTNWYVGLSTLNSAWDGTETAATVHTARSELESYDEATRPAWNPNALATTSDLFLSDTGAEVTFTLNAGATVYGAFLISASAKNGTGDSSATLAAGSNFTGGSRSLLSGDTFKVGYRLNVASS